MPSPKLSDLLSLLVPKAPLPTWDEWLELSLVFIGGLLCGAWGAAIWGAF